MSDSNVGNGGNREGAGLPGERPDGAADPARAESVGEPVAGSAGEPVTGPAGPAGGAAAEPAAPADAAGAEPAAQATQAEQPTPARPMREPAEDHSVTMDDGTVVRWESWSLGEESRNGKEVRVPVTAEGEQVAEYVRVGPEEAIATNEGPWDLDVVGEGRLVATLPDGRVFTAGGKDRPKLARAKTIHVEFGDDRHAVVTNEGSQNYVIEDGSGNKLGQFTGANRGVRTAEIQFDTDEGRALPDEEKLFLTWVARRVLEFRMVSMTWMLTIVLLLLIAYLVWAWIA